MTIAAPSVTPGLMEAFQELPVARQLHEAIEKSQEVTCSGVLRSARGLVLSNLAERFDCPILWITPNADGAERLMEDLDFYSHHDRLFFPEREVPEGQNSESVVDPMQVDTLERVASGRGRVVVSSVKAVLQKTISRDRLEKARTTLCKGESTDLELLVEFLVSEGYHRTSIVERRGEFALRGDIVDLYPITGEPVRVELFDEEVESIRIFDKDTQRSVRELDKVELLPATNDEVGAHLTDFLPRGTICCLEEPAQIRLHALEWAHEGSGTLEWGDFLGLLTSFRRVFFTTWEDAEQRANREKSEFLEFPFEIQRVFPDRVDGLMARLPEWCKEGRRIALISRQASRLAELVQERELEATQLSAGRVVVVPGSVTEGFRLETPSGPVEVFSDREIVGALRRRKSTRKAERASLIRLDELAIGDMVVHVQHGIGRYNGVKSLEIQGNSRDFLSIEYAKGDNLFVPVDQLDLMEPYKGLEERVPRLSKMGGQEWARTRKKVKKNAEELAEHLLKLYAQRELSSGHAYPPDTPWQKEMEEAFPYEETDDQLRVIGEVKSDLEQPRPMDRLVCGDVGYGKTEVAIRAAFKVASEGRQVAVLVPTTVLAHQHFQTFSERLAAFPVRVEVLSRFRARKETTQVLTDLALGEVDIVIGTHRLLSKDVKFKTLGLLVVDEEQRFGVKQKERIKEMRHSVDILTLTATPIPRTLNMAMVSIRDMSVIETPPEDRVPIKTYLFEHHPDIIRGAIMRELAREGQVYFVHNRVQGIERVAQDLRRMLPSVRVAVGHGQMGAEALEKVMMEFLEGEYDVLVCTTIIESGLDIPNTNTIIINNAHYFGLAQLYQMRGRVGRSSRQAYCYLLYPPTRTLTPEAEKRLETIRDFTQLGAGFQIALRDLEIRGAGDILGAEQSGSIASVGFDLYCRMIRDSVATLRGEAPEIKAADHPVVVELPVPASLPEDYVSDSNQKVALYKRIAAGESREGLDDIRDELRDRFGPLPEEAENLLQIMDLKFRARELCIPSIRVKQGRLTLLLPLYPELTLNQKHKLWVATKWKVVDEPHALVMTGLFGVAAGNPVYPPAAELIEKIRGILDRLQRWKDEK